MKKLNQILREGVYDPIYLKPFSWLVFQSGKTFVTRSTFDTGLKLVNSDIFEKV